MSDPEEPMFIGWATASRGTVRSSIARAAVLALVAIGLGVVIAASMRSPGADLSPFRTGESLTGLLVDGPTPLLLVADDGGVAAVILAGQARNAADPGVLSHDGEVVTLTGNVLERGGRRMLEVGGVETAHLEPSVERTLRDVRRVPVGRRTLHGEIVDAKCYLGRMRPGAGRAHRACAQSCIGGGVPPILVTHDGAGGEATELELALESTGGESVRLEVLPFVTEPVEITGDVFRFADLEIVQLDVTTIRRL